MGAYVLNADSFIPVTRPGEYEERIPPDEPCIQTFPSVSFHRCHCVSVKCVERVLSVDSEAVLGVWLPAPLPTPRALPDRGALWPLTVGVEKDLGGIDV